MFYKVKVHNILPCSFINSFKLLLVFTLCFCFTSESFASQKIPSCQNNPPLKVAVMAAGLQKNSLTFFSQILKKLGDDGFVAENNISKTVDLRNKSSYRKYVTDALKGKCLEFPSELSFVYNWEPTVLKDTIESLSSKISNKEIDLIFALGDIATKYLAEDDIDIPAICFDTNSTDMLKRLAKGKKNIVIVDDSRNIKDDISLFHTMFGYTGFGFFRDKNHLYDMYNAYSDVMLFAKEKNFQIKVCEGSFFVPDVQLAREEFVRCTTELSKESITAVFLPELGNAVDLANFYTQLRPLLTKKIPVLSYDSKAQVEAGSLLSVYDPNEYTRATYAADVIERLVSTNFDYSSIADKKHLSVPLSFGVNLKTASLVQWRPSFDVLVAVDDIFHTIKSK